MKISIKMLVLEFMGILMPGIGPVDANLRIDIIPDSLRF